MYLTGWDEISTFVGRTRQTISSWHKHKLSLPILKSSDAKQGKVYVLRDDLILWVMRICHLKLVKGLNPLPKALSSTPTLSRAKVRVPVL